MDSSESRDVLLAKALAQVAVPVDKFSWETPEDLARLSHEASIINFHGDARFLASQGQLRIHGKAVPHHTATLDAVSTITSSWQKAVTAIGASLEGFRSVRGKIPATFKKLTEIGLSAQPSPGSLVLSIEPTQHPISELDGNTGRSMLTKDRPLVDRATSKLIQLISGANFSELDQNDAFGESLSDLGPRAAGAMREFALALELHDVDLDMEWSEPAQATSRGRLCHQDAIFLRKFIEGRALDTEVITVPAKLITVSSKEKWLIEFEGSEKRVDATALPDSFISSVSLGSIVSMDLEVGATQRPDGTLQRRYRAKSATL